MTLICRPSSSTVSQIDFSFKNRMKYSQNVEVLLSLKYILQAQQCVFKKKWKSSLWTQSAYMWRKYKKKNTYRQTSRAVDCQIPTAVLTAKKIAPGSKNWFLLWNDAGQFYPVFAAGVFKGAENERTAAVVLHVVSQVLSGDVGRAALVWALHRKSRAVVLVVL